MRPRSGSGGSTLWLLTWKGAATPSGRRYSVLRARAASTSGTASTSSGWPTPVAASGGQSARGMGATGRTADGRKCTVSLKHGARPAGWPTPNATETDARPEDWARLNAVGRARNPRFTKQKSLTLVAKTAGPGSPLDPGTWVPLRGMGAAARKAAPLAGWPKTPQAHDAHPRHPRYAPRTLGDLARLGLVPSFPARLTARGKLLTGSSAGMGAGGRLRPEHSRWIQGIPPEWDEAAKAALEGLGASGR